MIKSTNHQFLKTIILATFLMAVQFISLAGNFHPSAVNPIANDDYFTTNEDVQLVANISTNDIQSNSGNNTWSIISNPAHGIVQLLANAFIRYTPASNYYGSDTFYYKLCANNGKCDTAMVVITINSVNDLPVARNDAFNMDEDNTLSGNVASNDTQSGDGGNVWSIYTNPINGAVLLNSIGTFLYVPNPNFNGKDSFYYRLCDVDGDCSTAKVVVTVRSVNDLPVVLRDTFSTDENTPLTSTVATNDTLSGDGGNSFSVLNNPIHGIVLFSNNGNFTYTPFSNYSGLDSFSYRLCDANGDCRSAYAVITINSVNYLPVALDNTFYTDKNVTLNSEVASNDTQSPDGGNTWSLILGPTNGNLTFNNDGSFDYVPNLDFIGADTFYYSLCDANNDCSYAMAIIFVNEIVPVRLLSFSANQLNQYQSSLQWNVEQEINVNRYEVQKSWDGFVFSGVASVNATDVAATNKTYSFIDNLQSIKQVVYYRLKMIDNDGKFAYSKVVAIQLSKTIANSKLIVYPNPFSAYINLTVQSDSKSDAILSIFNSNGQKFTQKNLNLNQGINNLNINDLNSLPKGIYMIEVAGDKLKLSSRIIKL